MVNNSFAFKIRYLGTSMSRSLIYIFIITQLGFYPTFLHILSVKNHQTDLTSRRPAFQNIDMNIGTHFEVETDLRDNVCTNFKTIERFFTFPVDQM